MHPDLNPDFYFDLKNSVHGIWSELVIYLESLSKVEKELESAEHASIGDYIAESGNIAALHNQISSCDGILARMEGLLTAFQTDLGSISNEILSLQQQSVEMNLRSNKEFKR